MVCHELHNWRRVQHDGTSTILALGKWRQWDPEQKGKRGKEKKEGGEGRREEKATVLL